MRQLANVLLFRSYFIKLYAISIRLFRLKIWILQMQHTLKKDDQKICTNSQYIKFHSNRHAYSSSHPYHCAVVIPYTASRRYIITPAPKKTMPDTICTATRDASASMLSPKPYFYTTIMSALPAQTIVCVRIPTSLNLSFLSYPIAKPDTTATSMFIKYFSSSNIPLF